MMGRLAYFIAALASALPASGLAQEQDASASLAVDSAGLSAPAGDADEGIPGALVVGAEVGAILPQPFSELGTHVAAGLELGYRLPFIDQRLEVFASGAYAPPGNAFEEQRDEGTYDAEILQQELTFSLGPRFRFLERKSAFNASLAAGGRIFLLRTYSNGTRDAQAFAEFEEQSTQLGFFVALGCEYAVGPGALLLDIDFGYAKLEHTLTGKSSAANITPTLGYRFYLL
ncbi:MAG: outer membrane beta-barrel protein [Myxococcales bacterium]|nr:outer membrane beta-barrel protein [Myxococcales bacterium]